MRKSPKLQRKIIEALTILIARWSRHQQIRPSPGIVKVNLGSSLRVAPGWINVDGSLSALVARWPTAALKTVYRLTSVKEWYTQTEYIDILRTHQFVFHNFDFGIPFPDESIDFIYTSHMLEHLYEENAERLVTECFRTLKRNGRIRIVVPDLEYAISLYQRGAKEEALALFFLRSSSGLLGRHESCMISIYLPRC